MSGVRTWIIAGCLVFAASSGMGSSAGCSGDDTKRPIAASPDDDAGSNDVCMDADGDGYGKNCSLGSDCDDTDPSVTVECRRCLITGPDCPCQPGTMNMRCNPPPEKVQGGTIVCTEGTRYCRDGVWGACETIAEYTSFIPD
jgi:hypothetical protein